MARITRHQPSKSNKVKPRRQNDHVLDIQVALGTMTGNPHSRSHAARLKKGVDDFDEAIINNHPPDHAKRIVILNAANRDPRKYFIGCDAIKLDPHPIPNKAFQPIEMIGYANSEGRIVYS